jgi:hypothetical protein
MSAVFSQDGESMISISLSFRELVIEPNATALDMASYVLP